MAGPSPCHTYKRNEMGGLYQSRENERDYVDKTEALVSYTTFQMLNMPEKWKDILTTPLLRTAFAIETCVEKANAIYMPKSSEREKLIRSLKERRNLLYEALRLYRDYDAKLERLMGQIDLMQSEKERLKRIMVSLIEEAKRSDEEVPEIRLISRMNDVEYRSTSGSHIYRLKLTAKQKDHLLKLESESKKAIRNRIEKDNYMLKGLGGLEI
ncbi:MAG: hypothetical protein IJH64_08690 [Oscillospiraceae bacterium]|nr:hypothetical protein [Oscillospiraceae bacterium]